MERKGRRQMDTEGREHPEIWAVETFDMAAWGS
jgi:hypothetical protein